MGGLCLDRMGTMTMMATTPAEWDQTYHTPSVMEAFEGEALRLAALYDQRNHNTSISDGIKQLKRYGEKVPSRTP